MLAAATQQRNSSKKTEKKRPASRRNTDRHSGSNQVDGDSSSRGGGRIGSRDPAVLQRSASRGNTPGALAGPRTPGTGDAAWHEGLNRTSSGPLSVVRSGTLSGPGMSKEGTPKV